MTLVGRVQGGLRYVNPGRGCCHVQKRKAVRRVHSRTSVCTPRCFKGGAHNTTAGYVALDRPVMTWHRTSYLPIEVPCKQPAALLFPVHNNGAVQR